MNITSFFFGFAQVKVSVSRIPGTDTFIPVIDLIGEEAEERKIIANTFQINVGFDNPTDALMFILPRVLELGFFLWFPPDYRRGEFDVYNINEDNPQECQPLFVPEEEIEQMIKGSHHDHRSTDTIH
jgi:hypothetical protein